MICNRCDRDLPESEFPLDGGRRGNLRRQCKECMRKINREYRRKRKERMLREKQGGSGGA